MTQFETLVLGPVFCGQVVLAHSPWFQTEPIGPSGVCVALFTVCVIDRDSSELKNILA